MILQEFKNTLKAWRMKVRIKSKLNTISLSGVIKIWINVFLIILMHNNYVSFATTSTFYQR